MAYAGSMADGGHQEQTVQPVSSLEHAEAVVERSEQTSAHPSPPPISYDEINAPRLEDAGLEDPQLPWQDIQVHSLVYMHLHAVQYSTVV